MAYRGNFFHGLDNAVFLACQRFNKAVEGIGMGRHGNVSFILSAVGGFMSNCAGVTDTLTKTLCKDVFVFHVDKLVFKGRATGVYNQNLHLFFSSNNIFLNFTCTCLINRVKFKYIIT